MTQWPILHLTAEDLDAFHSASLSEQAKQHLLECGECRSLVEHDGAVLAALTALPAFSPSVGFAERVVAGLGGPAPARVVARRPAFLATRGRLAIAASLLVALGASIVWSLVNRDLLNSWIQSSAVETGRQLWLGVRVVATNLTAQPWYGGVRDLVSSPGRLAAVGGGLLVVYGAALLALRKLLTPPSRPVPHANW